MKSINVRQKPGYLFVFIVLAGLFSSCTYRFAPVQCAKPVPGNLVKQAVLDTCLMEPSGLLCLDGHIWSHNDSGGDPVLYCVDPESGGFLGQTVIRNAENADWEDITMDDSLVYIADVGDNFATRDTLLIYMVPVSSLRSGDPVADILGIIRFTFNEQVQRNPKGFSSHDCEALFVYRDSIYLFTKNWVDESTSVYIIPAEAGHYNIDPRYRYDTRMLVTGADLDPSRQEVTLVGYRDFMPVVITYGYSGDPAVIRCGGKARIYPLRAGRQVEGICYDANGVLYISAEKSLQRQSLFKLGPSVR